MARFDTIKATIDANIKSNGNQGITGQVMNSVLNGVLSSVDESMTQEAQNVDAKLTELSAEVDELESQINGAEKEDIDLYSLPLNGGLIASGVFQSAGNYGLHKHVLIAAKRGRTLVATPINTSTAVQIAFLKDNQLIASQSPNYCDGTTFIVNYDAKQEYEVPRDCQYIYVYAQTKDGTDRFPTEFYYEGESGIVDDIAAIQEKVNDLEAATSLGEYGVRWSISDVNDLGERCFDAVGKNATIGIGSNDGASDFDGIFPWSEIKRCNIKTNANGAKIVTFEGEDGFSLNGDNGDVFVRIPRFSVKKYIKDGYEYRVIAANADNVHPAFIEDGKVLDEIFISAFEGVEIDGKLHSIAGVIPTNNLTASQFLSKAVANGAGFSLFDNRCVDLLWTLMAVEYGCRNSNHILGYGYSGYLQAATYQNILSVTKTEMSTNSVTLGKPSDNSTRLMYMAQLAVGQNICICGDDKDGSNANIIAQRTITAVRCDSVNDNIVISFDGEPIDVYAKTDGNNNYTYVGNAPATTNMCETAIGDNAQLKWHTGRSARSGVVNFGELFDYTANPCRYRWIENPIGNLWHFLPDVTFVSQQMYVCNNMKDYECHKHTAPYYPIGDTLVGQQDNGNKLDITNANYWIDKLVNDIFAKGNVFGKSYNKELVSTQAFGAYYYLRNDTTPAIISHGGGFDHLWRCNMLTLRAWQMDYQKWYLYGARLMYKFVA